MGREGWVKFHRKTLDSSLWQLSTPEQKVVWMTICALANHSENEWEFAGKKYICKPGQLVTSLNSLADACGKGVSVQNVRTALTRFEKLGLLTNQSTKTGRLITIEKWGIYQGSEKEPNKAINEVLTKSQQSINKDLTSNKNNKELKNVNNINPPLSPLAGETKEKTSKTDYIQMIKDRQFDKSLEEVIVEWHRYKTEKRQAYKPTGFSKFLTEVQNNVIKHGVDAVIDVANVSMANNWQGIAWDKLKNTNAQQNQSSSDVLRKYLNRGK